MSAKPSLRSLLVVVMTDKRDGKTVGFFRSRIQRLFRHTIPHNNNNPKGEEVCKDSPHCLLR